MKKLIVTIAVIVIKLSSSFAAEPLTIDPKIISAFEKEFSFAKNVKWESREDLTQVSFLLNDQAVTAWYNSDAELVTIARNILYSQLPVSAARGLEKDYPNASFYGIIEVIRFGEVHYQVTAETTRKTLVLSVTPSGSVYIKKRIKKRQFFPEHVVWPFRSDREGFYFQIIYFCASPA